MDLIENIRNKVIEGNVVEVQKLTMEAIESKIDVLKLLKEGFTAGLDIVGQKFSAGEFFLPELLVAGMAAKTGIELLKPLLIQTSAQARGVIVIGTVKGDVHDIGKNIVSMLLEGAGFKVVDLGVDVPSERYIDAAKANGAHIIAMSALLSTTRAAMPEIIRAIRDSGLGNSIKIMAGGAPVTQEFADSIGADGYAPDAVSAVRKAEQLLE